MDNYYLHPTAAKVVGHIWRSIALPKNRGIDTEKFYSYEAKVSIACYRNGKLLIVYIHSVDKYLHSAAIDSLSESYLLSKL